MAVFFQDPAAQADPFFGKGVSPDTGNHHDIAAPVFFHQVAGDLLKSVSIGKGHVDAAFIFTLQHEDGQLLFLCETDDVLIDNV